MKFRSWTRKFSKERISSSDWIRARIEVLFIFSLFFVALIIFRLLYLQIFEHIFYETLALGQRETSEKLLPVRGEILAPDYHSGDLYPIATNQDLWFLYSEPIHVENPEKTAKELSPILGLSEDALFAKLKKQGDRYEPIQHGIDDSTKQRINALNFRGIAWMEETSRLYPMKLTASHITGFMGFKDDKRVGQYGLEGQFEKILAGVQGKLISEQDANGRWIMIGKRFIEEAKDGDNIILTIDYTLQNTACKKLSESVQRHGADEGSLIIMDPKTGALLALCNYPDFDPNQYGDVEDLKDFNNLTITDTYEPGSVFKAFTMAAALDLGKVTPNTTYHDTGSVTVSGYKIQNSDLKAHGSQTMMQVLEKSLNTGAIYAIQQVGNTAFYEYVQKFGFGELTEIDLPHELKGNVQSLSTGKDIYSYTASYGQGITVTPMQLICAYSAIANEGKLMKPYIVSEIQRSNGQNILTEPQVRRQVISKKTSMTLSAMLVDVIQNGHTKRAGVKGYFIAGKTGTAQVPDSSGGYAVGQHKDTFIGFGPMNDPKFVMLTQMDNPRDVAWADSSAAPLFGEVAEFLLHYYQIPPDNSNE